MKSPPLLFRVSGLEEIFLIWYVKDTVGHNFNFQVTLDLLNGFEYDTFIIFSIKCLAKISYRSNGENYPN